MCPRFFDDILVYSPSIFDHVAHLRIVFELLRKHKLFLKRTKCTFGSREVVYLGHIVHGNGVAVDQTKIEAIRDWPKPHNIRTLRGFLGLTGYYRKFIRDYGIIAGPLTGMLRRNSFMWGPESELAFTQLKEALSNSQFLHYQISQQFLLLSVMHQVVELGPSCNKTITRWLSLVGNWLIDITSFRHMNES